MTTTNQTEPQNENCSTLELTLRLTDPEVVEELSRVADTGERDRVAKVALRIGVLSLRTAVGNVDANLVRRAGQELVADVRQLLVERSSELTNTLSTTLVRYFDTESGLVPQRLDALLNDGGELDRLIRSAVTGDDSAMAKTLTRFLGKESEFAKLLSADDAHGFQTRLEGVLSAALGEQRDHVLREFSMDRKDSALSRLVEELRGQQEKARAGMKEEVEGLVRELSLDHEDSALSRLVSRVEQAQQRITREFSLDTDGSALSRMSQLLRDTRSDIESQLSLDHPDSALSRLRRELGESIETLTKKNQEFHAEVRETLAALSASRAEAERGTRHGKTFEDALGAFLAPAAQKAGDLWQATGNTTGTISHCKVGDHIIEMGPESSAPGGRVVFEAKQDKSYDLRAALGEIEKARKNRQAQTGVFVFSIRSAPDHLEPFARYGDDIVVVWDDEDPQTDVFLCAAMSLARALTVRQGQQDGDARRAADDLDRHTRSIEKQSGYLVDIKKWATTVENNGRKIAERSERMCAALEEDIAAMDALVLALKQAG